MENTRTSWEQLYETMEAAIVAVKEAGTDTLTTARACMELCKNSMDALKVLVQEQSFTSEAEEVYFFKYVKPRFHRLLIFYSKLFDLELRKPASTEALNQQLYSRELLKVELFFESHVAFFRYYRSGETDRDHHYFTRSGTPVHPADYYRLIDEDKSFNTPMDYLVSKMLANELLVLHLQEAMRPPTDVLPVSPGKADKLVWTDKDISFYELVYFLLATGVLNGGQATATAIARALGSAFNKKVDNTSKKLEEIRLRKKERAAYITTGLGLLHLRMDEDDLRAR